MTILKQIFSFLRHYWYIPAVGLAAVVCFLVFRGKKQIINWSKILKTATEAHSEEIKAIEKANREQIEATNRAVKRAQEAEEQIRAQLERDMRELDAVKQKRVKKILKDFKDDPTALVNELERETGYRVIVVD